MDVHILGAIGYHDVQISAQPRARSGLPQQIDSLPHGEDHENANCIQDNLMPAGTAVRSRATHACMTNRGVCKSGTLMTATTFTGVFLSDLALKHQFLNGQI